ncbi:response regulator [Kineosporia succinea]|uniref:Two-component system chemotaxis response regulator CheY n=1 Tax=Kineosporia succinea TaxID=84632 RepID=A0ABT9P1D6_9ACTN|nr:response regulator [Kineosporia succinea]MDP9826476.1 two-component system chemotaxis response regulator CheY [Kineosporia succinea]
MKILVTDDSRAMRMIVIRTMRQAGLGKNEIKEAENGRQGFETCKDFNPDLILSDWNMPEMNGIEFLKALRASGNTTPFCFVTSEGSDEMREQALAAGAIGLIVKPFTAEAFMDTLGTVVSA